MRALVDLLKRLLRRPVILALVLIADLLGFVGGIAYWYGQQLPVTPVWSWPFVPDCPLFGLVGGLALLTVIASDWSPAARREGRRALVALGGLALAWVALASLMGGRASELGWARWIGLYNSMFALLALLCLLFAAFWERTPNWLLSLASMGQIKYGIWTVVAWTVFWINSRGNFTFESLFMTATHLAMIGQGLILLAYFRPTSSGALIAGGWFLLSDFVDYGLGFYPRLPRLIPLSIMQWHTIAVTFGLTGAFWRGSLGTRPWMSARARQVEGRANG